MNSIKERKKKTINFTVQVYQVPRVLPHDIRPFQTEVCLKTKYRLKEIDFLNNFT